MKIHHLEATEALQSLKSSLQGLSSREASRRLQEFGLNKIEKIQQEHWFFKLSKGFIHFFALVLWLAAALAFFAEFKDPGKGMATLGFAMIGVILINGFFSFWQEFRTDKAILALRKLLPDQVKVLRDEKVQSLSAAELVPGDVILLEEGDNIPADCRVIEAFSVRVNNATITGETFPRSKNQQVSQEEELVQSKNILLAGTAVVSGTAKALIYATGMHTEFGKIAHLTQTAQEVLSPLQKEIIALSRIIALIATVIGMGFFLMGSTLQLPFWQNFIFAIGIIVANVPEGLLPTVTLALAMAAKRMSKRNALIRHLASVETLGSATVICTDKTGTLTQNRMTVKKIFLSRQFYDRGDIPKNSFQREDFRDFFETAYFCHSLKETQKGMVGDPMEKALFEMAQTVFPEALTYPRRDEIPFDSDRKRMSVLHQTTRGLVEYTKGAAEMLLPLCRQMRMGEEIRELDPASKEKFLKIQESMAIEGLRVLAMACRVIPASYDREHLEEDLIFTGFVGLEDPPRPEVPAAIERCQKAGIKIIMITGDHPQTAQAIGRQIGLVTSAEPVLILGERLKKMSASQLQLALEAPEIIFARVGADQKSQIVEALMRKKEIVAVTGDGVNDAPALKKAHIGIAMGLSGTDVAREASDMILLDDNFASIVSAVEEGRAVFSNIQKFLTYILTSNVPELIPYLAFVLFRIPLALTVIQILAVDLGTDMLPAIALGTEKPEAQLMQRPPRAAHEKLWSPSLLSRAYLFLGPLEALAAMAAFFYVLKIEGWQYGQILSLQDPIYLQATTACLSAIIPMQIVNVFLCRSETKSAFSFGLFSNPLLLWGIFFEIVLILIVDYAPMGNKLFGTAPIGVDVWLFMIPFALSMLALEELRKRFSRKSF